VHIESGPHGLEVRFRIDGVLRKRLTLPAASHRPVVSRIKVMANMDISVKRRPQDGGLTFRPRGVELRLRVSTLPVEGGEKVVVRILDPSGAPRTLDALGLSDRDAQLLRQLGSAGQGVILAAGPTGSGKSSSLFAALAELNREGLNIVTLEDPVEYTLPGINQVQVNPRAGLTFPSALRAILRQDPDVVMVGEIRDRETAEIAMTAAVTGHLVMSSLHTIDAPGAIARLLDMGVPPFLVAGGLTGVVAQRLLRRVCRACRGRDHENCHACVDGLRGRIGVFQVLTIDDAMREEIIRGASISSLRRLARARGMITLAEDARRQVAQGMTTPHEVARVIHGDPGAALPCTGCGMDIPSDAIACPRCGRRRRKVCPCGRWTQSGWRFCPWCLRRVQT
jgi:type II secretory ATPase GspE/PulE/Tfp pilus assembly ATPase PilB-like protein